MTSIPQQTIDDARKYHEVMRCLQNMQMPHGQCQPRERRACTHCNAKDKLDKMLAEYRGAPVVLAKLS